MLPTFGNSHLWLNLREVTVKLQVLAQMAQTMPKGPLGFAVCGLGCGVKL